MPAVTVIDHKLDKEIEWLEKGLRELEKAGGKKVADSVWKYSQRFAATLIARTAPKTKGGKAGGGAERGIAIGEAGVKRDIKRAYMEPRAVFQKVMRQESIEVAKAFWHILKTGTRREVEGFLNSLGGGLGNIPVAERFDGGGHHKRARMSGGGSRRGGMVKSSAGVLVMDWPSVKPYLSKIQGRVFYAKAAWVSDFRPPGGVRGMPLGDRRHPSAPGKVRDLTKNTTSPELIFENNVDYIQHIFFRGDFLGSVRWINDELARDIEKQIIKAAKQTDIAE